MRVRLAFMLALVPFVHVAAQAEWTVGARPQIDVAGTANGAVVFEVAGGATRLHDGSLLIVDRGAMSIRLIDATGKLVKTIGRSGRGPGEYPFIAAGWGCGHDSLLVWSPVMGARMLGPDGTIAREFRLPSDSSRLAPLLGVDCRGASFVYLSQPTGRVPSADGMYVMQSSVVTASRDGRVLGRIDSIPSGEWMPVPRGAFPRPLGATASAVVVAGLPVVGVSDSARVWVIQPNGARTRLAVPYTPRAPSQADLDAGVAASASMAPIAMRPTVEPLLAKAPMPKFVPPFFGLYGDPEGTLWVQQSVPGSKETKYLVLGVDGRAVGRLTIPVPFTIYEIGRDYVLGLYSDANDEEHVAVYRLSRK